MEKIIKMLGYFMGIFIYMLLIFLISCANKVPTNENDLKPGRPRYQSESNIELNKWIEEEWPIKKDSVKIKNKNEL